LRLSVDTGISFDPTIINTEALRWARDYSYDLVSGLTDTTRRQLQEATAAFIQTPGMTIGDIEQLITPAFGPVRSEMIAVTEVTRAYSSATNELQKLLQVETPELVTTRIWNTMKDEYVCFPDDTIIITLGGIRFIEHVKPGDMVQTRQGYRRVIAVNKRDYDGELTLVKAGDYSVISTPEHPFWTDEDGWISARALESRHTLRTIDDGTAKVREARPTHSFTFAPIQVYNLEVEDESEYYANGILVHNCKICGPLEGAPESEFSQQFPSGPPAHPNCRCSTSIRFETQEQLNREFGQRQRERNRWLKEQGLA